MNKAASGALESLLGEGLVDQVVSDCVALVNDEVAKKKGLSAVVIKGGLKVVSKIRPNILNDLFYSLLPSFVEKVAPLYERFIALDEGTRGSFASYLSAHSSELASLLLEVTDRRAQVSKLGALVKVYQKLRPLAQEQIVGAVPALGTLLAKHGVR